jgi:hypothetical protein
MEVGEAVCAGAPPCGVAGAAIGAVVGDVLTGSAIKQREDKRVTVYRAVDPVELAHIKKYGNYGSNPSQSGKYFALTVNGAEAFAKAPMNAGSVVTSTTLPQSVVDQGHQFNDPGNHGAGPSVFFAQPQLPTVYGNMTPIVIGPGG